ncbi:bifunctional cobalt-precorrin-7 (C(5))-methyltransferase/cobalt-precorrin-6B (C(15))-methyltransferase, partial [Desulfovibrio sp. XJ01]|nr:bifunctional cobalt-precorrin-7 (C(5))-methyltransferase/cobalt-precorrin-6B (C(15))-methyltransferase [Nitratidesulfovibrio liaohensis]
MTHATPPHPIPPAGQTDAAPAAIHPVTVIGCGLRGTPLPSGHAAALAQAQVLAGGARLLESFPEHPGQRIIIGAALDAALQAMDACRALGLRVAVLADGDPLFFGIGARLAGHFGPE